MKALIRYGST